MRRPRRFLPEAPTRGDEPRVNDRIRVPRVLVIDELGNKLGEMPTQTARELATQRGLDLVEVAPNARPPVCRIMDYGKMKYEKSKKEAVARRARVEQRIKEVKLRPKTDIHDFEVKERGARRFLEEGNKVKVTVRFRGREHAHREIGAQQCLKLAAALTDVSTIEQQPRLDGSQMVMILAPTRRPVPRRVRPESEGGPPDGEDEEDEEYEDDDEDLDDDELDDDDDDDDGAEAGEG